MNMVQHFVNKINELGLVAHIVLLYIFNVVVPWILINGLHQVSVYFFVALCLMFFLISICRSRTQHEICLPVFANILKRSRQYAVNQKSSRLLPSQAHRTFVLKLSRWPKTSQGSNSHDLLSVQ